MEQLIKEGKWGLATVSLRPCTAAVLSTFLPGRGLTVWIRGYRPEAAVRWWTADLPLSAKGPSMRVDARDVVFDLQLPEERFLELLPQFEEHGLDLYLMSRPVPNTLTLSGMEGESQNRILVDNGLVGHFDLPHAGEVAVLSSPSRETLSSWLQSPLREWVL